MKSKLTYVPPAVSRWYRWDWQFAADLGKIPFVQEAALVISITPILVFLSSAAFPQISTTANTAFPLWMLWTAAMAFIFGRLLYYFGCPNFVQEYRDFGQYAARQHSHRLGVANSIAFGAIEWGQDAADSQGWGLAQPLSHHNLTVVAPPSALFGGWAL